MRRRRSALIVIVLVAAVGMTAVLAAEAWRAAQSHRQVTERVLREYAAFAAWELSGIASRNLYSRLIGALDDVERRWPRDRAAVSTGCASCGTATPARAMFRITPGGPLETWVLRFLPLPTHSSPEPRLERRRPPTIRRARDWPSTDLMDGQSSCGALAERRTPRPRTPGPQ